MWKVDALPHFKVLPRLKLRRLHHRWDLRRRRLPRFLGLVFEYACKFSRVRRLGVWQQQWERLGLYLKNLSYRCLRRYYHGRLLCQLNLFLSLPWPGKW